MVAERETDSVEERLFLLDFEDDTEEAPWMVNCDYQRLALTALLFPLDRFARRHHPEWYISSDLPILYARPNGATGQVAPDMLVAVAPNHPRESFDSRSEGGFPAFVMEVVSTESRSRDTGKGRKVRLYDLLGAREYVIFDPPAKRRPPLAGYRRGVRGTWEPWSIGPRGELRSQVLVLTLVPDGTLLRLEDADGRRLLTADEEHQILEALQAEVAQLRAAAGHSTPHPSA